MKKINVKQIYIIFIAVVLSIGYVLDLFDEKYLWLANIARYILYILIIRCIQESCLLVPDLLNLKLKLDISQKLEKNKDFLWIFLVSTAVLVYLNQPIFKEDFFFILIAYLVVKYPELMKKISSISYGVGMACSYSEGYLSNVIPSDGASLAGFLENINIYEDDQGVVFPVKRFFIIITKSMYCPPDLKHFNKENRDNLPHIESCKAVAEIKKDVAGLKGRSFKNPAYMIHRPGNRKPVFLSAECATPLHTLYRVLQKSTLYSELTDINKMEVIEDFCTTLQSVISKSPEFKNKCELVYFDDTDPEQNLADVLLDKIRELEPNFENVILNNWPGTNNKCD